MKSEDLIRILKLRFKFDILSKYFERDRKIDVCDFGSGNNSAFIFKNYYPYSTYTGVNREKTYHNNEDDYRCMDCFIQCDLAKESILTKTEKKYDLIIMSYIIEHLKNGEQVIEDAVELLKEGGII